MTHTYAYMVRYLTFHLFVQQVIRGLLALFCAMAGMSLFRVPMWQ